MLFTLVDIQSFFRVDFFDKGKLLVEENCVEKLNVVGGGNLLTAIIKTSSSEIFRVYIRIQKTPHELTLNGECSCDVRNNCEHVVAVLLKSLFESQTSLPEPLKKSSPVSAVSSSAQGGQCLIYLLIPQQQAHSILIKPGVKTRSAHGVDMSLDDIKYFAPSFASRATPARFLTPDDINLLNRLNGFTKDVQTGFPQLTQKTSTQFFIDLLATKRCYLLGENKRPLTFGDARQLSLHWTMDRQAFQHLQWNVSPSSEALFLAQAWYIDTKDRQCGLLVASDTQGHVISDKLITDMLSVSPVSAEQTDCLRRYADIDIPGLKILDIKTMTASEPIPCLQLCRIARSQEKKPGKEAARFSIEYDGINIMHNDSPYHYDGKQVYRVVRDEKNERQFIDQLLTVGLTTAEVFNCDTETGYFTLVGKGDTALKWLDFQLDKLPVLREQGWRITIEDDFRFSAVSATQWHCHVAEAKSHNWFDLDIGVDIDGEKVDLIPALLDLMKSYPDGLNEADNYPTHFVLSLVDGRVLKVSAERLRNIFNTLLVLFDENEMNDNGGIRISKVQLSHLAELENESQHLLRLDAEDETLQLVKQLRNIKNISPVMLPVGLHAELRPYQQKGFEWLQFLRQYQFSGVLADEMGLGKTLQTLAHIQKEKEQGRLDRPVLIVVPTSLLFNWRQEIKRFTPDLTVLSLHGQQRHDLFKTINEYDLILTTYSLLHRDEEQLLKFDYHMLILDEAQIIKNPNTKASQAARHITARHRLCLTGTPMENHLGELWSLFDFLMPGFLGDRKYFQRKYRAAIEKKGSEEASVKLSRLIRPFLLRRTKDAVSPELPSKTEMTIPIAMEGEQRDYYESVRLAMHEHLKKEVKRLGIARCQIVVLNALLKLRQICCDPRLLKISPESKPYEGGSAKLELLMSMLTEMIAEGRRILLFSQFTSMLMIIEERLSADNMAYSKLTGQTQDRESIVSQFQNRKVPLLLISLKAGGVGLNLTEADVVIHYDPWWNPAVEQQATARAHRIGQQNPVFIYKLICQHSVEEKIQQMQQNKQALINTLYNKDGGSKPQWNHHNIDELFGM